MNTESKNINAHLAEGGKTAACGFDAPTVLTFDEAVKLLPEGDTIHTFRNPRGMMLGTDWHRAAILDAMRASEIQVTGPLAQAMHHGLCIDSDGLLFIEAANYYNRAA